MNAENTKLEKLIKEHAKQINDMKKVITALQNRFIQASKKINRTYESTRKNTNEINSITRILGRK